MLKNFEFEEQRGATLIVKEPIGVCGLITPWNWPINQIACKVFPALATGCTMVLKPSEVAPYSAQIFTEIIDAAGVPAGVFNLVHGDGPGVGAAHCPAIPTSTWSPSPARPAPASRSPRTRPPTVKRVTQELGGKSPNIVLDDEDFAKSVAAGVSAMMMQLAARPATRRRACWCPTRRMDEAIAIARERGRSGHGRRSRRQDARSARWRPRRSSTRSRA